MLLEKTHLKLAGCCFFPQKEHFHYWSEVCWSVWAFFSVKSQDCFIDFLGAYFFWFVLQIYLYTKLIKKSHNVEYLLGGNGEN